MKQINYLPFYSLINSKGQILQVIYNVKAALRHIYRKT